MSLQGYGFFWKAKLNKVRYTVMKSMIRQWDTFDDFNPTTNAHNMCNSFKLALPSTVPNLTGHNLLNFCSSWYLWNEERKLHFIGDFPIWITQVIYMSALTNAIICDKVNKKWNLVWCNGKYPHRLYTGGFDLWTGRLILLSL